MRTVRIVAASLALAVGATALHAQTASPRVFTPGSESAYAPPVDVWLDQISYDYGDRIRPYVATQPGAYITIVRVSSDGELRVLYPRRPGLQKPYRLGELVNDRVPYSGDPGFNLYESTGTGFVFAISSYERFDYRYYAHGGDWSVARLANAGRFGDPFEIIRRFVDQTLDGRAEYSMDYAAYEVNSSRQRSRYASRYGHYAYDDYYDLCLSAFGFGYTNYCRSYNGGYYGPYIFVNNTPTPTPAGSGKTRRVKPLVVDPMLPGPALAPQPAEGRFPVNDPREASAMARRERMLRDAQPRIEMKNRPEAESRRAEPARIIYREPAVSRPRPEPARSAPERMERPRAEPQRAEPARAEPRVQAPPARVEVRNEPRAAPPPAPRAEPARVERPQKDNS